jgi:hypothetical protein
MMLHRASDAQRHMLASAVLHLPGTWRRWSGSDSISGGVAVTTLTACIKSSKVVRW